MSLSPVFEPLAKSHNVEAFTCGKPSLDRYLHESARRDRSAGIASVFVLAVGAEIIGYYTLHQHVINASEMPETLRKRLSKYLLYPATLIGRMAVDVRYKGKGFGRDILLDALRRAAALSEEVASLAVVVEALDAEAQAFYERYGFVLLDAEKRRLFLPMKTVAKLLSQVG